MKRWLLIALALGACENDDGDARRLRRDLREARDEIEKLQNENRKLEQMFAQLEQDKRSGLKVTLPGGAATDIDPSLVSLVIVVPAEGDIVVDGTAVPDAAIENLFRAAFLKSKDTQVVFKADQGVPHGRMIGLMEQAKAAGLTRLAIGTQ